MENLFAFILYFACPALLGIYFYTKTHYTSGCVRYVFMYLCKHLSLFYQTATAILVMSIMSNKTTCSKNFTTSVGRIHPEQLKRLSVQRLHLKPLANKGDPLIHSLVVKKDHKRLVKQFCLKQIVVGTM